MPETILVVEHEPRYVDRVQQALAGQPFQAVFAEDGEEALHALQSQSPSLIVVSSIVPKIATPDLIRAIRGRRGFETTPILLTVSGYSGTTPREDAMRFGASELLPKPYTEREFLLKVRDMLGRPLAGATSAGGITARSTVMPPPSGEKQLTSNEIFGDLLDDHPPTAAPAGTKKPVRSTDLDKMVADTLSGLRQPPKKREGDPAAPSIPKTAPGTMPTPGTTRAKVSADLDKLLSDTLSGLEKSGRPKAPTSPGTVRMPTSSGTAGTPAPAGTIPAPRPAPVAAPPVAAMPRPEKVPISAPVFPPPASQIKEEEPEPTDGTRFGQYVLLEKIAVGGMAEVWKARRRGVEGFQKIVAIKKILPHLSDNKEFIDMFVDEAKLAAQLNHNNIIHIYDLGKIGSSYYIAMEYIDGQDLKSILRQGEERNQPPSPELALFIASKIASALEYAHRKRDFDEKEMGLVHRDVSPQNVLVSYDGDIKLCDFGIAKAVSKASQTQSGALKGKLQYMSPEQAWGKKIDRRTDVFALGAVLYEMLTGQKLFAGDNEMSILEQVRETRFVKPSEVNDEVSPETEGIVLKALQRDPEARYQSAGEMARDLDAILYTFRPTPTSADLAIHMHRLYSEQAPAPAHDIPFSHDDDAASEIGELAPAAAKPVPAPRPAPVPAATPPLPRPMPAAVEEPRPIFAAAAEAPRKRSAVIPIAIVTGIIIAVAVGFWMFRGRTTPAPATASAPVASTAPAAPAVAGVTPAADTASTTSAAATATATAPEAATASQPPLLDQSKIEEEVRKRLGAEKARLEQQRAQKLATAAPPPVRQTAPPPTQTVAPAPERTTTKAPPAPAPAPVQTQTQAPAAETRAAEAAPQPAAPARAREGDLVPVGTEGLQAARLLRRAAVVYPRLARVQRVEGLVVLSVLVSETGKVLDVKLLRGVSQAVGLNEAAEECMRRSTFAPATKDGVPVKSYVTVPVAFRL